MQHRAQSADRAELAAGPAIARHVFAGNLRQNQEVTNFKIRIIHFISFGYTEVRTIVSFFYLNCFCILHRDVIGVFRTLRPQRLSRPHFLSLLLHNNDCSSVKRWLQIMREDGVLHTLVMLLDTSAHTPHLANLRKYDYVQMYSLENRD